MASLDDWTVPAARGPASFGAARLLRLVPLVILPTLAIAILALVAWVDLAYGIPVNVFTRDMAALAGVHPFVAVVSSLGAFLMCATAACCLFAFSVAREKRREIPWHLLAVGLLSLYVVADDFYEFHDRQLPTYLGIPQEFVYALIAVAVAAIAFRWWRHFLAFRPWFLGAALLFLSASMGIDLFDEELRTVWHRWQYFVEDAAKFVGISLWATYFIGLARHTLARS